MFDTNVIVIENTLNHFSIPCLVGICFLSIIIYLYISIYNDKRYKDKLRNAEMLIREGHEKALHGRKDDGVYQETKREKERD